MTSTDHDEQARQRYITAVRNHLAPLCRWGPRPKPETVASAVKLIAEDGELYLKQTRKALLRALADLQSARRGNEILTSDVQRLEAQHAQLVTDLDGARAELDDVSGRLRESEASCGAVEAERDQLAEKVADLEGRLAMGRDAAPEPPAAPPAKARNTARTAPGATETAKQAPARTRGPRTGKTAPGAAQ